MTTDTSSRSLESEKGLTPKLSIGLSADGTQRSITPGETEQEGNETPPLNVNGAANSGHHQANDHTRNNKEGRPEMTFLGTRPAAGTGAGPYTLSKVKSIRHDVAFREKRFDLATLPLDMQRVYSALERKHTEEYALTFIFMMRTAMELHRAWHMTLLTNKVLQQVKEKFNIRTTWNLGVLQLIFRVDDGAYELQRKVPYDYDSEFQDLYARVAVALVEGHIGIHDALIFQTEIEEGKHTAQSGLFLRNFPGRLLLYPFEAATCTVIFFGGDWRDGGVAAVCGLAAGLVDFFLGKIGGNAKVLVDVIVGIVTGIVGGLFYKFDGEQYCLAAIFLGTLYWFFYGTAFVIGLLEIMAGELGTGVTRFIAVSVKTFVLSLGASFGMQMVLGESTTGQAWLEQEANCNAINLEDMWWRIPLYLLCSVSVLGQYRFPIVNYWRGLTVQLVAYEVQFQCLVYFTSSDFLDTATANVLGDIAAVVTACLISYIVDNLGYYYNARLLQRDVGKYSKLGEFLYKYQAFFVHVGNWLRLGRKSDQDFLRMEKKLKQHREELRSNENAPTELVLTPEEEFLLIEAIVSAENINVWSVLMPAVYQLVPGSLIARLWFGAIFPPPLVDIEMSIEIEGTNYTYINSVPDQAQDTVFQNLMVTATSLALGLVLGFAVVRTFEEVVSFFLTCFKRAGTGETEQEKEERETTERKRFRQSFTSHFCEGDESAQMFEHNDLLETIQEG